MKKFLSLAVARLLFRLEAGNECLSGSVSTSAFPEDKKDADASKYFCHEDDFTGDHYHVHEASINAWEYDGGEHKLTLVDQTVLSQDDLVMLQMLSKTGFPCGNKAILQEGREGISLALPTRCSKNFFGRHRHCLNGEWRRHGSIQSERRYSY